MGGSENVGTAVVTLLSDWLLSIGPRNWLNRNVVEYIVVVQTGYPLVSGACDLEGDAVAGPCGGLRSQARQAGREK